MLGHQSMFVVTPDGVIATDPIGFVNKKGGEVFLAEIRKVTSAPVKYVVYSHHHYDHIAGGKPFKDAGATFVAHRNAHKHLAALQNPDVVLPDQVLDDASTLELGGTRLDLIFVGRNHSDNTLVMHLPKEKLIFTVDWLPVQAVLFRDLPDGFLPQAPRGAGERPMSCCPTRARRREHPRVGRHAARPGLRRGQAVARTDTLVMHAGRRQTLRSSPIDWLPAPGGAVPRPAGALLRRLVSTASTACRRWTGSG